MDDKKILDNLTAHDMHVHVLDGQIMPFYCSPYSTHFVMNGGKVVFVGTVEGVNNFALRLEKK